MKTITYFIVLASVVFLVTCGTKVEQKKSNVDSVKNEIGENLPLLPDFNEKTENFTFNSSKPESIKSKSGSIITIQPDAFVDADGKPVAGNISIKYQEIKTAGEIIAGNIDMSYDSAGVKHHFQTAGMFKIEASSANAPVFIQQGKRLEVSYVSNTTGTFGFYSYQNNAWKYESISKPDSKSDNRESKLNFIPLKPVKVNPATDLVIDIEIPFKNIPELSIYKKIMWKYVGDKPFSEIRQLMNRSISTPALKETRKSGEYLFTFSIGKTQYELPIAPVFGAKDFDSALKSYNAVTISSNESGNTIRKTSVSSLGLKNFDRIYHRPDAVPIFAEFEIIDNGKPLNADQLPIFQITGDDDVVIKHNNGSLMYFARQLNNKIVVILPEGRVALINNSGFSEKVKNAGAQDKIKFRAVVSEKIVRNSEDLDKIISEL